MCVVSNNYPGHSDGTIRRRGKDQSGQFQLIDLPLPSSIKAYNKFMGGVDKSDQLISYHRVLRQTKKYWRTIFYHLLEICATNAAVLKKWRHMEEGSKAPTMSSFRDALVLDIIEQYGVHPVQRRLGEDYTIRHGSTPFDGNRRKCVVCHEKCSRWCTDCPFSPALCQSSKKKCHEHWHSTLFTIPRSYWFARKRRRLSTYCKRTGLPKKRAGRHKGSKDKKKRVVN